MDYLEALIKLLPPGLAMNPESIELHDLLAKTAAELHAVAELDAILFGETDPRQATFLLPEYEASLGLPDRCSIGIQTLTEQRAAVYAKLVNQGGARRSRYLAILSAFGYPNSDIERHTLTTCENDCENALFDHIEWLFTWSVTLPENPQFVEATCESHCQEPLATWGNTQIECVLHREKQAHTHLIFKYIG